MTQTLILASTSTIRRTLLENAGVPVSVVRAPVDEDTIKAALQAEGAKPRDIADALAEMKAARVAEKGHGGFVLGCDQVLEIGGTLLSKPRTPEEALEQLRQLAGKDHRLLSAAVIFEDGQPVWRCVGEATLTMRTPSDEYLQAYVARNWDSIRWSVGGYKVEEEGARLFYRIVGDSFTVMGLPLLSILAYLTTRGVIDG
jgi:septum formation protein